MRRTTGSAVATVLAAVLFTACAGSGTDDSLAEADTEAAEAGPEAAEAQSEAAQDESGGDDSAGGGDAADGQAPAEQADGESGEAGGQLAAVDLEPRDIIYRVDLLVETDDIERATQRATTIATAGGGFVADEHSRVDSEDGEASATLTLRVPSADHLGIVEQLEGLGEVRERSRNAEDVTEQVADVESRIESQRQSIDRIRQLLQQASDIDDVVRIESELARREAELDSLLQRQASLSDLTSLATVTVTFQSHDAQPDDEDSPPTFLSGLGAGWNAFVETVTVAGAAIGAALPFVVAAGVVGVPGWLVWRRRRRPNDPVSSSGAAELPGTTGS